MAASGTPRFLMVWRSRSVFFFGVLTSAAPLGHLVVRLERAFPVSLLCDGGHLPFHARSGNVDAEFDDGWARRSFRSAFGVSAGCRPLRAVPGAADVHWRLAIAHGARLKLDGRRRAASFPQAGGPVEALRRANPRRGSADLRLPRTPSGNAWSGSAIGRYGRWPTCERKGLRRSAEARASGRIAIGCPA